MSKPASLHKLSALLSAVGALILCGVFSGTAVAQTGGSITGTVTAETGIALSGVDVGIVGTAVRSTTDEHGAFHLTGMGAGTFEVRARRLGFRPESTRITVDDSHTSNVDLKLPVLAEDLKPVLVRGQKMQYTGRLAGYYERLERRTSGVYITRDQIDRDDPRNLTQLLQRVPGITLQRLRSGGAGIRMRDRACLPLIWLDGQALPMGEVDIDGIQPKSLEGIELYLGSTTAPFQYNWTRNAAACGTILLWTRGMDTAAPHEMVSDPAELEALVASLSVFTADQVDKVAVLDSSNQVKIPYPPPLYAAHVRGEVLAEFIVDSQGRVEEDSFGIVSSTHPLFSAAVRSVVNALAFIPAVRAGKSVRQLVHQPFAFDPAN
jgi:TonB family protein